MVTPIAISQQAASRGDMGGRPGPGRRSAPPVSCGAGPAAVPVTRALVRAGLRADALASAATAGSAVSLSVVQTT